MKARDVRVGRSLFVLNRVYWLPRYEQNEKKCVAGNRLSGLFSCFRVYAEPLGFLCSDTCRQLQLKLFIVDEKTYPQYPRWVVGYPFTIRHDGNTTLRYLPPLCYALGLNSDRTYLVGCGTNCCCRVTRHTSGYL